MQLVIRGHSPDQGALPVMQGLLSPFRMGWEPRAEAYKDIVVTFRRLPEGRKRDLSIRTIEIALREASKLARWHGARDVWLEHFEWGLAWATRSRDMVLAGANERMKVKRDFEAICRHIKNLLADGPMIWTDIRLKSRSAAGSFGMNIIDDVMKEMTESKEIRELGKEEQILRGLRKPTQPGAVARWFELGQKQ